jgi:hypothetical protein
MILKWFWHNPHLVLTSAALSWAGHAVAARLIVGEVSPLLLMQLRWFFLFFDPAGDFSERNGGALASNETAVAVCGADGWAWAGRVYLFIQPWRATYHSG